MNFIKKLIKDISMCAAETLVWLALGFTIAIIMWPWHTELSIILNRYLE
jgi:hypothetical protein